MARLLVVHHSPTPTVRQLAEAVLAGALAAFGFVSDAMTTSLTPA